jgi:hypothetical protein
LLNRYGGDGKIAKAVEAIKGGNPNTAFAILKETGNVIARETVRMRKHVRPSLVYVQETSIRCSNPQTAIAVPEQPVRGEPLCGARKRIRLGFPVN